MNKAQQKKLLLGIICVVMLSCVSIGVLHYSASPQGKAKDSTTHPAPPAPSGKNGTIAPSPHPLPDRAHSTLSAKATLRLWVIGLLLSMGIASGAGYFLWKASWDDEKDEKEEKQQHISVTHNNNDYDIKPIVALGGLLVFFLYIIPKCVNRVAAASLAHKNSSPFLKKIARFIQHYTDCWIHPNLEIVCPTFVAGTFGILYLCYSGYNSELNKTSLLNTINTKDESISTIIKISAIAYFLYRIRDIWTCKVPAKKMQAILVGHIISFFAFTAIMGETFNYKNMFITMFGSFLCYILIVVLVHTLLHNLDAKGYKRTPWHTLLTATLSPAHDTRSPAQNGTIAPSLPSLPSQALGVSTILESTFMVLFGAYGPFHPYFHKLEFKIQWPAFIGATLLLMVILWANLHVSTPKYTLLLWVVHLLLSSSGARVAFHYLQCAIACNDKNNNNDAIQHIVGLGGFLVFFLYIIPKCVNRIAAAALTLKDTSKIARFIQHATACWLHPNLDVISPTIVGSISGVLYLYQQKLTISLIGTIGNMLSSTNLIVVASASAYVLYGILEGWAYIFPGLKLLFSAVEHLISFVISLFIMLKAVDPPDSWWPTLCVASIYHMLVVVLVHTLLHILNAKGYKRTTLPTRFTALRSSKPHEVAG